MTLLALRGLARAPWRTAARVLVLADEPTAELDERNEAVVLEEFGRLRGDFGATVVVVTHSPAVAASADRVLEIRDGRVVV